MGTSGVRQGVFQGCPRDVLWKQFCRVGMLKDTYRLYNLILKFALHFLGEIYFSRKNLRKMPFSAKEISKVNELSK